MRNSKKFVILVSLVVLVATNIISPLTYATAGEEDIIDVSFGIENGEFTEVYNDVEEDSSATSQNNEDTQDGDEIVISNDSGKSIEWKDSGTLMDSSSQDASDSDEDIQEKECEDVENLSEIEDIPTIDRKGILFDISALNFEKPEIEFQTQATANVTEPYGHIEYDLNGNEHFEAQVITISDGETMITILDRNLGATVAGTGCEDPSSSNLCIGGDDTYGYHFQWGNNYGFKSAGVVISGTDKAVWSGVYANSGYYGSIFIKSDGDTYGGDYWTDSTNNSANHYQLWGGSLDDTDTFVALTTEQAELRRGPCPENFHVPSIGELDKLKVMLGHNGVTVRNKLLVPFAGLRSYSAASVSGLGRYTELWSSSPTSASDPASRDLGLNVSGDMGKGSYYHAYGASVRCFYNEYAEYLVPASSYTLTLNPNGGEVEGESTLTTDNEGKVTLPGATREPNEHGERVLEGWFASTGVSEKIGNSGDVITLDADKTVYAHWAQTITIFDLKNPLVGFTVLDRNLGAVSSGIDDVDSYGFYYQWGDDHGHLSGEEMTSSEARLEYKSEYDGHGYDGEEKRHINIGGYPDIWENNNSYPNLWGGGSDSLNESNGFVYGFSTGTYSVNNVIDRQGPCPDGYHVPSYGERAGILNLYYESINQTGLLFNYGTIDVSVSDGDKNFINALHLPYAGHTWSNFSTVSDDAGLMGYYWTSTPASNTYESLAKKINKSSGSVDHDRNSRAYGYSVRCFKNEYVVPTYTVTFNPNNGDTNPENITVTYDSQYPELPVVNKTGYTFSGWYNGEEIVNSGDIVKITEDTTLIAKRTINQYKIIFDTDGGNEISPIEKDYNSVINITLPTPTKECNEFSGWNIELPETMPAHDITLKAIWNYTCSRSSGGGGAKKSESTTREIAIDTPTEQEHNSANEEQKSETPETSNTPINGETTHQVISVTQEVSENGTVEAIVETVKIKNTDIVATVRTEVSSASSSSSSSSSTIHTKEQNDAYNFAKSNGITTTSSIEDAKMNTELTRIQMAKMLSNFAINVLGQEPDTEKGVVKFDDVTNQMDKQYDNAVTKAYQLGIMGQNMKNNKFRPSDEVTRAEFVSSLSRLLYNTEEGEYKGTGKYYIPHVAKLYNEGIINKADPKIKEKRGYVMTMLMRTVQ